MGERAKFIPPAVENEVLRRLDVPKKQFYYLLLDKFSDNPFSMEELISILTNSKKGKDYENQKRIATDKLNSLFQNGLLKVESKGGLRTYQIIK